MRPPRLTPLLRALASALALLATACGEPEPTVLARATGPAAAPVSEPESCRACHAEIVDRFEASAHRLAARRFPGPGMAARLSPDAPIEPSARPVMSLRPLDETRAEIHVADATGASEARTPTHVLGGRRREDFLAPVGGRLHVLPVSWSISRNAWIHPLAEELGGTIEAASPVFWTSERRAHENACSRCHVLPADGTESGIGCATCHGDASAHVARAEGRADATTWARDGMRRATADTWSGCAPCHALASDRPKAVGLPDSAPFTDLLLPATFAGSGGLDRSFRLDGTPGMGHGMEVQSLATSPCFVEGGATCLTCHDPHGGPGASLKDPDPDASCRGCHAAIAADAASHARHPVAASPVPWSRQEPAGMATSRLPGCVDCHAPSLLPFGMGDLVRDHAIGVPNPLLDSKAGIVNSCMGCHPDMAPAALARSMPQAQPDRKRARERRLEAFLQGLSRESEADASRANALLAALVADPAQDAWSRASAAHLLTVGGPGSQAALPALESAWTNASDPALTLSAANAYLRLGGAIEALKARLAVEEDWRIALSIGAALAARGDARGLETVEVIYGNSRLPPIARADAGSELAVLLIQQGACHRASSVLTDSLARNPASVPAWLNLGVARVCLGDGAGAREAFERVLQIQPDHVMARNNLASLDAAEER